MEKNRVEPFPKGNGYQSIGERAGDTSYEAGKRFGQMATDISDTTSNYMKNGRAYVKGNPLTGVGIAATAGAIVGSIMTLALHRKSHV